jgi:thiol-disulfide isomerase/thioredoxin
MSGLSLPMPFLWKFFDHNASMIWGSVFVALVVFVAVYIHKKKKKQRQKGGGNDVAVKLFKTSTCPHCVSLQPTWDKLSETHVDLGVVQDGDLANYDFVEGVPTIAAVNTRTNDLVEEFSGPRTHEAIEEFIEQYDNNN